MNTSHRGDRKTSVCSVNSELDSTLEEITEDSSPQIPSPQQPEDAQVRGPNISLCDYSLRMDLVKFQLQFKQRQFG